MAEDEGRSEDVSVVYCLVITEKNREIWVETGPFTGCVHTGTARAESLWLKDPALRLTTKHAR